MSTNLEVRSEVDAEWPGGPGRRLADFGAMTDPTTPPQTVPLDVETVRALRSIDRRLAILNRNIDTIRWLIVLWTALAVVGVVVTVVAGGSGSPTTP